MSQHTRTMAENTIVPRDTLLGDEPKLREILDGLRTTIEGKVALDGGTVVGDVAVYVEGNPAEFNELYTLTVEARVASECPPCTFRVAGIAHPAHDRPAVYDYTPAGEPVMWWCPGVDSRTPDLPLPDARTSR